MTKMRMGMVGGGEGAFIGVVHRMAGALDGRVELVCGAFSRDTANGRRCGAVLGLSPERVYDDYQQMMQGEAELPVGQRMQFVSIATPNNTHYPIAVAALGAGFHVLSEKPATLTLAEVLQLREQLLHSGLLYGLAHTYTAYPMVKEAQHRIAAGELGRVRKVLVEYPQGWLTSKAEDAGNKQAQWRQDPTLAGPSGCMADIGVHAANLAETITGLQISQLCADLTSFVDGRELDDDGSILLRFSGGARGVLTASQICAGEENALSIRVYGDKGSLEWRQQEPNSLWMKWPDRPTEMLRTGAPYLCSAATDNTRLPQGHPEGYLEAFANLYLAFAEKIRIFESGDELSSAAADCPGIDEAVRGMAFIELAVASSASETKWHDFPAVATEQGVFP